MSKSTAGLVVYVASVLVAFVVLSVDLILWAAGRQTITEWATGHPLREWGLLLGPALGLLGLAVHLYFFREGDDGDAG